MRIGKPHRGPDDERSARVPVTGGRFTFRGGWAKTTPVKVGDDPYAEPDPESKEEVEVDPADPPSEAAYTEDVEELEQIDQFND